MLQTKISELEAQLKRVRIQRNDYQQECIKLNRYITKLKRGTNISITEQEKFNGNLGKKEFILYLKHIAYQFNLSIQEIENKII
jgi:cell division protein FtsL